MSLSYSLQHGHGVLILNATNCLSRDMTVRKSAQQTTGRLHQREEEFC